MFIQKDLHKVKKEIKILVEGAISVALGIVLSIFAIKFPFGGMITIFGMSPILVFSYRNGWYYGLIAAAAMSSFHMLYDWFALNPWSVILDYIVTFFALALPGLFKPQNNKNSLTINDNQNTSTILSSTNIDSGKVLMEEINESNNVFKNDITKNDQTTTLEPATVIHNASNSTDNNDIAESDKTPTLHSNTTLNATNKSPKSLKQTTSNPSKSSTITRQETRIKLYFTFWMGVLLYFIVRLFAHTLSGVLYWTQGIDFLIWQGDLYGLVAWGYSLTYNILYLLPDTILALIGGIIILNTQERLQKQYKSNALHLEHPIP